MKYIVLIFSLCLFCGCATLFNGQKSELIEVNNGLPAGAKIYYHGNYVGTAPMTVFVPKTAYKYPNNTLEIKAVGYKTKTVTMTREIRWACAILDAPLVLPLLFDIQSNNIWHSSPRKINYNLEKE